MTKTKKLAQFFPIDQWMTRPLSTCCKGLQLFGSICATRHSSVAFWHRVQLYKCLFIAHVLIKKGRRYCGKYEMMTSLALFGLGWFQEQFNELVQVDLAVLVCTLQNAIDLQIQMLMNARSVTWQTRRTSSSLSFSPMEVSTVFISLVDITPLPSLSNTLNASLSATHQHRPHVCTQHYSPQLLIGISAFLVLLHHCWKLCKVDRLDANLFDDLLHFCLCGALSCKKSSE